MRKPREPRIRTLSRRLRRSKGYADARMWSRISRSNSIRATKAQEARLQTPVRFPFRAGGLLPNHSREHKGELASLLRKFLPTTLPANITPLRYGRGGGVGRGLGVRL